MKPTVEPTSRPTLSTVTPSATPTTKAPSFEPTTGPTWAPFDNGLRHPPRCFAGSETIMLENGEQKSISDVETGDRILSCNKLGTIQYSEVIAIPHSYNNVNAIFTQITTDSSRSLKSSPDHMIGIVSCIDSEVKTISLTMAKNIKVGMCIVSISGPEKVSSIESVQGYGLYTIITNEEFIVVNGFVVSPYAINHAVTHGFYNVYRTIYKIAPYFMKVAASFRIQKSLEIFESLIV
jgi:hypothetical protein